MTEEIAQLREAHSAATTAHERATIEQRVALELRRLALVAGTHFDARRDVASVLPAASISSVEEHAFLYRYGESMTALWRRIDQDMTLGTAMALARRAKSSRGNSESLRASVERVLAEYDSFPQVRYFKDGKQRRFPAEAGRGPRPHMRKKAESDTEKSVTKQPQPKRQTEPPALPQDAAAERAFWAQIRAMSREYAMRRTSGYTPESLDAEVRTLETDLKVVFDAFSNRIQHMTRQTPVSVAVLHSKVREACRVLHVDPPLKIHNVPVGFFSRAQKQFRSLARAYHTDTTGTDASRPQFEAVMEAWKVIQQFKDSLGALAQG